MINKKQKVVIAGGGSAGWMTAAALSKLLGHKLDICLVESEEIGRIGVGEATIPPIRTFNKLLGINEKEFVTRCKATFKLGIEFKNWGNINDSYIHSFGTTGQGCWAADFQHFWLAAQKKSIGGDFGDYCLELQAAKADKFAGGEKSPLNYAYHLDAGLYANFLQELAIKNGVNHIEGKIIDVVLDDNSGEITELILDNNQTVVGDLFIDCTGFSSRLMGKALNVGYESYQDYLLCDAAVAVQSELTSTPKPYTQSIAHDCGWQWRIPLQHRVGNGLVFSSKHMSDGEAIELLMNNLDGGALSTPKVFKYKTGRRLKTWHKNCVAIGLSSGFIEPLESTAIHIIMSSILRLMRLFPHQQKSDAAVDEFNQQSKEEMEFIRDFIVLHYKVTNREDSDFWKSCKNMNVPETLNQKIKLFEQTGNVNIAKLELFKTDSWTQVMIGQGLLPQDYHSIVELMSEKELTTFLEKIRLSVNNSVAKLPNHQEFIDFINR